MAPTKQATKTDGAERIVDSIESMERSSLEAMRRMVDTVDDALPVLRDSAPRRKVIDSAFQVAEQVVDASNQFTRSIFKMTEDELGDRMASKPRAKKASA